MHFTTTEFIPYRYKYYIYYNLLLYPEYNGIKLNLIYYIVYIKEYVNMIIIYDLLLIKFLSKMRINFFSNCITIPIIVESFTRNIEFTK